MLLRFSHVMIYSQKHEESVRWYCEKLGFEIVYNAASIYAFLHHKQLGGLAIHASKSDAGIGRGPMPYLLCDDIQATIKELRAKGIKVSDAEREDESPWFCDFWDIDGNIWGVEEK